MAPTGLPHIQLTWAKDQARIRREGIVYYLERFDGAVKIGCTVNYPQRRGNLLRRHGPLNLIAYEFGYYQREAERHREFAWTRIDEVAEWFVVDSFLYDHVLMLRALL